MAAGALEAGGKEDWGISLPPTPRERPSPFPSPKVARRAVPCPNQTGPGPGVIPPWGFWPLTSQRLLALKGLDCYLLLPLSVLFLHIHYFPWWFWGSRDKYRRHILELSQNLEN